MSGGKGAVKAKCFWTFHTTVGLREGESEAESLAAWELATALVTADHSHETGTLLAVSSRKGGQGSVTLDQGGGGGSAGNL